jgi:hypothetical protein
MLPLERSPKNNQPDEPPEQKVLTVSSRFTDTAELGFQAVLADDGFDG